MGELSDLLARQLERRAQLQAEIEAINADIDTALERLADSRPESLGQAVARVSRRDKDGWHPVTIEQKNVRVEVATQPPASEMARAETLIVAGDKGYVIPRAAEQPAQAQADSQSNQQASPASTPPAPARIHPDVEARRAALLKAIETHGPVLRADLRRLLGLDAFDEDYLSNDLKELRERGAIDMTESGWATPERIASRRLLPPTTTRGVSTPDVNTRRQRVLSLVRQGTRQAAEIAAASGIARQEVSNDLQILRSRRLVDLTEAGWVPVGAPVQAAPTPEPPPDPPPVTVPIDEMLSPPKVLIQPEPPAKAPEPPPLRAKAVEKPAKVTPPETPLPKRRCSKCMNVFQMKTKDDYFCDPCDEERAATKARANGVRA